jgi:hypothetical protein
MMHAAQQAGLLMQEQRKQMKQSDAVDDVIQCTSTCIDTHDFG